MTKRLWFVVMVFSTAGFIFGSWLIGVGDCGNVNDCPTFGAGMATTFASLVWFVIAANRALTTTT